MVKIANIEIGEYPLLLAPMEDVSDPPFRVLCKEEGADVVFTEFISSEGLIRDARRSREKLDILKEERPVGIQIFGHIIESMMESARIVERAQPEFLDINYGCPVKNVAGRGAGAGILRDICKMEDMTRQIVQSTRLPVTVKTRLGWDENSIRIVEVALRLQDAGIKSLTIHGRTRVQMYKGSADWEPIEAVASHPDIEIPIFGNGDVKKPEDIVEIQKKYPHISGVMLGRAAIGNPWVFREMKHFLKTGEHLPPVTLYERAELCRRHLLMSIDWKGMHRAIFEMRKHYSNYFKGIPNFKPTRMKLVTSEDFDEILAFLDEIGEMNLKELKEIYH